MFNSYPIFDIFSRLSLHLHSLLAVMDEVPEGEEEDIEIDPEKEAYYIDDPKKALRKFFDREGLEFEYETEEDGPPRARVFTAKVR